MSKIEIVTQPEDQGTIDPQSVLDKLDDLIQENPPLDHHPNKHFRNSVNDSISHQVAHDSNKSPKSVEGPDATRKKTIDDDGFEVPQGKIPLDGHFSTNEIQGLISIAKQEGLLKEDVELKILDKNDKVGDKVVILEKDEKREQAIREKQQLDKQEEEQEKEKEIEKKNQ